MSNLITNPYAPAAYNGLTDTDGLVQPISFPLVYDVTLTALQNLPDQQLAIPTDADWWWQAWMVSAATGQFKVRFSDSQGYYLSNGYRIVNSYTTQLTAAPEPVVPMLAFPAGSRIGIDLIDLSNASNTIQIVFYGQKRYTIPGR